MAKVTESSVEKKCDIYISYCHDNEAEALLARSMFERLTRDEYSVFYDNEDSDSGEFPPKLLKKIEECTDFIIIVGERSFHKPTRWYCKELAFALEKKKHIMPILKGIEDFSECRNIPKECEGITVYRKFLYPNNQERHNTFYTLIPKVLFLSNSTNFIRTIFRHKRV